MSYLYLKALHIVFVVTWFAGMFYMVRLLVYHREAQDNNDEQIDYHKSQLELMMRRLLFGITWPSAWISLVLGLSLLWQYPGFPTWLIIKLCFVFLLFAYQYSIHYLYRSHLKSVFPLSGMQLRMWNELATIFLVAIVFLVVVKSALSLLYSLAGLFALILVLLAAIRMYKKYRSKHPVE